MGLSRNLFNDIKVVNIVILTFYCTVIYLSSTGCGENKAAGLTKAERTLIDTLYLRQVEVIRNQVDSICSVQHDSLLKVIQDSITMSRIQEIIELNNSGK